MASKVSNPKDDIMAILKEISHETFFQNGCFCPCMNV